MSCTWPFMKGGNAFARTFLLGRDFFHGRQSSPWFRLRFGLRLRLRTRRRLFLFSSNLVHCRHSAAWCHLRGLCRLLGRLKSNYQLSELVRTEGYVEWLEHAAAFTTASFEQWQASETSARPSVR